MPSTGGEQTGVLAIARSFVRCPAGQQGQPPHVIIDVRERRPDLSPPRFHGWDRGRVRSFGFCRWSSPRAQPRPARAPRPPGMRSGRLPLFYRVASIEGNHRMSSRSGAEEHRSSALPVAIARHGDFAPTPVTSRCLLSRPSPSRPVRSDVGGERYRRRVARLQGAPQRGPCDDELPRRSPTLTSPRHLPSRDRSRANEG